MSAITRDFIKEINFWKTPSTGDMSKIYVHRLIWGKIGTLDWDECFKNIIEANKK